MLLLVRRHIISQLEKKSTLPTRLELSQLIPILESLSQALLISCQLTECSDWGDDIATLAPSAVSSPHMECLPAICPGSVPFATNKGVCGANAAAFGSAGWVWGSDLHSDFWTPNGARGGSSVLAQGWDCPRNSSLAASFPDDGDVSLSLGGVPTCRLSL